MASPGSGSVWQSLQDHRPLPLRWLLVPSQRLLPRTSKDKAAKRDFRDGPIRGADVYMTAVLAVQDPTLASRSLLIMRTIDATPAKAFVSLTAMCLYAGISPLHACLWLGIKRRRSSGGDEDLHFETDGAMLGSQPHGCQGELWVRVGVARKVAKTLGIDAQVAGLLAPHSGVCSIDEGVSGKIVHNWLPVAPSLAAPDISTASLLAHSFQSVQFLPQARRTIEPTYTTLISQEQRDRLRAQWEAEASIRQARSSLGRWTLDLLDRIDEWDEAGSDRTRGPPAGESESPFRQDQLESVMKVLATCTTAMNGTLDDTLGSWSNVLQSISSLPPDLFKEVQSLQESWLVAEEVLLQVSQLDLPGALVSYQQQQQQQQHDIQATTAPVLDRKEDRPVHSSIENLLLGSEARIGKMFSERLAVVADKIDAVERRNRSTHATRTRVTLIDTALGFAGLDIHFGVTVRKTSTLNLAAGLAVFLVILVIYYASSQGV
ncbi:unnamed protein product [Parajaminaea phylloscopi]